MEIEDVLTDAKTGETIRRTITMPDTMTPTEGQTAAAARLTEETNAQTLRQQALAAMAANKTYIAKPTKTAADKDAQIIALTRQQNAVMRLLLNKTDATD